MVSESLLSKIAIPAENIHRVITENPDAKQAAADSEADLRKFFELRAGDFPKFDLILLGLGSDGHTASLFPDSEGLNETSKLVIANWVEKFKTFRITFTFPVLNNCAEAMFLVSGADKSDIVGQILKPGSSPVFPSQRVQPNNGRLIWMLDEGAASKLPR